MNSVEQLSQAGREIYWNVQGPSTLVVMYGLFAVSLIIACIGIWRRIELWTSGQPSPEHWGNWLRRFQSLFVHAGLQKGVIRKAEIALAHTLIYIGFLALLFATTMVFIHEDLGIKVFQGQFYLGVSFFADILGFGLLIGCLVALQRRYLKKPDCLHNAFADQLLLFSLILLVIQGFLLEGIRIQVTQDPWAGFTPVGLLIGKFFWAFSDGALRTLHFLLWWFHTITVFALFAIFPYTKYFHILSSSVNLFFRPRARPKGQIASPGDLESLMEKGDEFRIGLENIKDYSWKQLMDLDACTSCGRCQEVCPAYNSGKVLSPKWLVLDTRNHALSLHADGKLGGSRLPSSFSSLDSWLTKRSLKDSCSIEAKTEAGNYIGNGSHRARNELVQHSVVNLGGSADARIAGEVLDPDVFWSCTTCMACVEACPVGINHVDMIMGNRQNMALMHGEIPHEASATLKALETRGNPFGDPKERISWIKDLDVRILQPGDSVDYLYWVGCVSAYDPRKQKIAKSLVKIMKAAGLSFGILGTAEACTGDPARRLGEENLFQTLAKSNVELLRSLRFETLVANCPHCFNTIKNEYPEFGNLGEGRKPAIIHHSQLLKKLVAENKIALKDSEDEITFHDPCYLGRYNDEYEAPREAVKGKSKLRIIEMNENREKGMCCGAGGGHFWMDKKVGERINAIRSEQAAETGAKILGTACPFCLQMMEDGMKLTNHDATIVVRDIAELIAERLDGTAG